MLSMQDHSLSSKHLLVAGTEEILQLVLSTVLQEAGYKVTTATDGIDALFTIETFNFTKHPFDLLIMDYHLSKLSWQKLTEKLDKLRIATPVIIIRNQKSRKSINFLTTRIIKYLETPFNIRYTYAASAKIFDSVK